jgi:hypothetical protein
VFAVRFVQRPFIIEDYDEQESSTYMSAADFGQTIAKSRAGLN